MIVNQYEQEVFAAPVIRNKEFQDTSKKLNRIKLLLPKQMFSPDFYVLNRSITLQNQNTKLEKTPQKSLIFVFAFRFFLFSFFLLLYLLLDSALILHLVTMYIVTRFYNNFLNNLYPIS